MSGVSKEILLHKNSVSLRYKEFESYSIVNRG